jgi:hypothetical protein
VIQVYEVRGENEIRKCAGRKLDSRPFEFLFKLFFLAFCMSGDGAGLDVGE